jgi:hypothetical protein
MQFCGATTNGKREARDGLTIGTSQARDGALSDAFAKRGDDLDTFFSGENVHGGPNPT